MVWGGPAPNWDSNPLTSNPEFANVGTRNFHLEPDSPAIDAGENVGISRDFDGNIRPIGSDFDIGAYEYDTVVATPAKPRIILSN